EKKSDFSGVGAGEDIQFVGTFDPSGSCSRRRRTFRAWMRAGQGFSVDGADARPGGFDSHAVNGDQRTDEQLLSAYRAGDKGSFATLVGRYQRELFHFLVRFLGDRAAA